MEGSTGVAASGAVIFEVGGLWEQLARLRDGRRLRGKRYPLPLVLWGSRMACIIAATSSSRRAPPAFPAATPATPISLPPAVATMPICSPRSSCLPHPHHFEKALRSRGLRRCGGGPWYAPVNDCTLD